jgi:hypothetical protein
VDIKLELAMTVCDQLGYRLFPARCIDCGFPILEKYKKNAWFVGCWFCHDRKERALAMRATLHKAKLAEQGILLEETHSAAALEESVPLQGRPMFGMPL